MDAGQTLGELVTQMIHIGFELELGGDREEVPASFAFLMGTVVGEDVGAFMRILERYHNFQAAHPLPKS